MNNLPVLVTNYSPIIDQFLLEHDVCENSKKSYRKSLNQFFKWVSNSSIQELTAQTILDFKNHTKNKGLSAFTTNAYLQAVKALFKWAEIKGLHKNIAEGIKLEKTTKGFHKDALTKEQAQRLILSIENQRNRAMTLLMISTGLRCIEITRSNVEDMRNAGESTILMVQGKGHTDKDDFVKVPAEVVEEIQAYVATRTVKDGDPLFASESKNNMGGRMNTGSISWIVKTALRNIGINDSRITAHSLRHTTATFSLLSGATLQETQSLMRHSSLSMVLIYSHNIDKLKSRTSEKIVEYMRAVTIVKTQMAEV